LESGLHGVTRLPFEGYRGSGIEDLDRFAEMARDPSGGLESVAAIIVETVQGEGGLNVASIAWLRRLREISREIGALLIIDDIQAGCGRTGEFFSFERAAIVPDIICLSKSLSGYGLPMSLLLVAPEFDVWQPSEHNGTFRGNSLAFVTATRALDFWAMPDFVGSIAQRSRILDAWTRRMVTDFPGLISRKKGLGMMAGIEFLLPQASRLSAQFAREARLLIERCGPNDEVLKVFAPINIDIDLFREGLERLTCAIENAAEGMSNGPRSAAA
jgi:diaminobutyrate-2-oxoglutarate transaminase